MNTLKTTAIGLAALGLLGATSSSLAIPTLMYTTNLAAPWDQITSDPFGGFDYDSAGQAVTSGFVADGTTPFTTEFWSQADLVKDTSGGNLFAPLETLGFGGGPEFTVQAFIDETATLSGNTATFSAVGGTFIVRYDKTADANLVTGEGITDGTIILNGTINPGFAGTFTQTSATGGSGNFFFDGIVTFTNTAFISPDLLGTKAGSEIKFGTSTGNWTEPTSRPDSNGGKQSLPSDGIFFQADGNQSFAIPEPGTLVLMGVGLLGLAGLKMGRRRSHRGLSPALPA